MLQHLGSSAPPPRRRPPRAPQRSTSGYPGFKAWERLKDEPLVCDFGRFCHHSADLQVKMLFRARDPLRVTRWQPILAR